MAIIMHSSAVPEEWKTNQTNNIVQDKTQNTTRRQAVYGHTHTDAHKYTDGMLGIHVYYVQLINRKNRSKAHPDADLNGGEKNKKGEERETKQGGKRAPLAMI